MKEMWAWRMRDTFNRDILNFEKSLPTELVHTEYRAVAIWSLVRMQVLNQITLNVPSKTSAARETQNITQWIGRVYSICKEGLLTFAIGILKSYSTEVIIRVNSFSILGETQGRIIFKNRNLQDILDHLSMVGVKYLIIVNDLDGYRLRQKLSNAIIFPAQFIFLFRKVFYVFNKAILNRIVGVYGKYLPLEAPSLRESILNHFATVLIWDTVYRYLKPKTIYFESPHYSFEPEIVAAKTRDIKTIEIYHGVITPNEVSYFQKHLNFDGLMHSICDEYLSPSKKQTKFLAKHNDKYKKITTIGYKSNTSLSIRNKLKMLRLKNRPSTGIKKILIIAAQCDDAISDVNNFLNKNCLFLLKTFKIIAIRLHPADTEEKWGKIFEKYSFVRISNLPLIEDVISSNTLIVGNTSVALQLKDLKIGFINISKQEMI